MVKEYIEKNSHNYDLKDYMPQLIKSFGRLQQTTTFIASKGINDPEEGAGPATDYLKMFALTSLAYIWVRYIEISFRNMNNDPTDFYKAKIATGKFFLNKVLPETGSLMSSILSGAKTYTTYENKFFDSSFN